MSEYSGLVTYEEFIPLAKDVFILADRDHNGFIDKEEFELCMKQVNSSLGLSMPKKEEVNSEFNRIDTDSNGIIDEEEFKVFIKETITKVLEYL